MALTLPFSGRVAQRIRLPRIREFLPGSGNRDPGRGSGREPTLAGFVAAFGLARRLHWGRPAVLAIGALNLAGAVVALANSWEGAAIGLVVSVLVLVLGWFSDRRTDAVPAFG